MKNLTLIIILLISFFQCTSQKQNEYFDARYKIVHAKIFKIEEKKNIYVYYFKNDAISGVFAKEKNCNNSLKSLKKVKINKKYTLVLHPMIVASKRVSSTRITINGDFVWDSDMKEKYYEDCSNICGDKIYEIK
jgi:hypothetical protein